MTLCKPGVMLVSAIDDLVYLASFVLGNLVLSVLPAVLSLAVGSASLGNVDLEERTYEYMVILESYDNAAVRIF